MLLEAVPFGYGLAPLLDGAEDLPVRPEGRGVVPWEKVPQEKVQAMALFFGRDLANGRHQAQPAVLMVRPPGMAHVRFVCLKLGGLGIRAQIGTEGEPKEPMGRVGIYGYRVGWYDPVANTATVVEVNRARGQRVLECTRHPCWPKRWGGLALSPGALGLAASDVPAHPQDARA